MSPSNTNSHTDSVSPENKTGQSSSQQASTSPAMPDEKSERDAPRNHGLFYSLKQSVLPWVKRYPHTVLCGFVGFIVAALILIIGFWPTLLLVVGVTIGILIGRYQDGDQKVRASLKSFLERIS